jgi:ATP-binding cassette, subfamily B, bacterial PglK
MDRYLSKFFFVLGPHKKYLSLLVVLFLVASLMEMLGIGLVGPFIAIATNLSFIRQNSRLNWLYEQFNFSSEQQFLIVLGVIVIGIFYIKSFLTFSIQKRIFEFGFYQRSELCTRLLHAYNSAPYTFHLTQNSAALMQNIMNETDAFSYKVIMPLLFASSNSIVIFAIVLLLVYTNVMAMAVIFAMMLLAFALVQGLKNKFALWGKERSESYENMIQIINHSLGGLKEARVIGCSDYFEAQAKHEMDRHAKSASAYMAFSNLPRYMIEAFLITFLVCFTFISLMLNRESGENLNSMLGIFAMASIRLLPALGNVVNSLGDVRYASHSLDKLYFDLKNLENLRVNDELNTPQIKASSSLPFNRQITLDHIEYNYPNVAECALNQISLTICKGESIGLIGRSGAGKTTLVDVILGLLKPQSGDIQVDGVSVYQDLKAWQNLLGYVPQTIFLTDDTLEHNIAFGVPEHLIDHEKLARAVRTAQLTDLVAQLPEGLQTRIGERGVRLSGGQRQRIGIARALYYDRPIIVLDEATAALDNETEGLISEAVKALSGEKTLIIIAHRLTTLEDCDRIYMLEKGQVVQTGSYQEVVLDKQLLG